MDYQETDVSGKQWKRCYAVNISNILGSTPTVSLYEEVVTTVGDSVFKQSSGSISVAFDPTAEIALLDPSTGAPLGTTVTQGQIHVALWSLYMSKALERDAALLAPNAPPVL